MLMKPDWKAMVKERQCDHVGQVPTMKQFPAVFKRTWNQVAAPGNAPRGFRRAGLYPLSLSGIDLTKFGPWLLKDDC